MPTDEITYLRNRRGGFKGRITGIRNELNTNENISLARAQSMLETIKIAYEKFDTIQAELERLDPTELESQYRTEVDVLFDEVKYRLADKIEEKRVEQTVSVQNKPKLPDLTVPKFTGNILQWLNFKNVFTEIINKHASLDNVSKYQYLETSLSGGSAHHLIKSISSSDYVTAWSRLEQEYNHMGMIREKHTKDLYDCEAPDGTAKSLQNFIDKIESNLSALRSLEVNVDNWDLLLIHHLSQKLDFKTRKEFEAIKKPDSNISYTQFKDFIKKRIRVVGALEVVEPFTPTSTSTPVQSEKKSKKIPERKTAQQKVLSATLQVCILCGESHSLFRCPSFANMDVEKRKDFVLEKRCCFNCLKQDHWSNSCPSNGMCKECNKRHNTLLHIKTVSHEKSKPIAMVASMSKKKILLATAAVLIENPLNGNTMICRAFLDSGATNHFITENIVQMLKLPKIASFTEIGGINDTTSVNKFKVSALIKSRTSQFCEEIEMLVSRRIVGDLPVEPIDISGLNLMDLADPGFNEPSRIDILLGAPLFFKILSGEKKEINPGLFMLPTSLGNIIVGQKEERTKSHALCSIQELKNQIQKFWDIEQSFSLNKFTVEEKLAEKHYAATVKRTETGRYSVSLPFNDNLYKLGASRNKTKQMFLRQENNLMKNPVKYQHYKDFIQEMIDLDHIEEEKEIGVVDNFITHHIISRPSSTTTQHRVVFNASMKTETGISLNDCLLTGPTIQEPIFIHIIHWREFLIALVGDIAKMYRQILLHKEDREYLKIWWRFDKEDELKVYLLKTVTYGTASAPFSATRTLQQLADDETSNWPNVVKLLKNNFYVDDFSASFQSIEEAIAIKNNLTQLLSSGGFELRKFASNSEELVNEMPKNDEIKILGITWNVRTDNIIIDIGNIFFHESLTKSSILSEIAQLFDPLGLCAPIILKAKIIMQKTWIDVNIKWDDTVPDELKQEWLIFRKQLANMSRISVPRALISSLTDLVELHGFCDASEAGYGACIYVRTQIDCRLVCAKSRVAPLKKLTIPRLELQSALLLSRLMKTVSEAMTTKCKNFLWSDSEITLFRIKSLPSRYCTFVSTRLSEIQDLSLPSNWFHIPSKLNPADVCSRGLMPDELETCTLWWQGPSFLVDEDEPWPNQEKFEIDENLLEYKSEPNVPAIQIDETYTIRFSSYSKLLNVTAYMIRFMINTKKRNKYRIDKEIPIMIFEREEALKRIVRHLQLHFFEGDLRHLKKNGSVSNDSRLIRLNPFIDEDGIMRVGGRLENAKLSYENQHQIILCDKMHLSTLILDFYHRINLHCGTTALLNTSRQRFWIINGRNLCKKLVYKCVTCFKNKPVLINQIMGQLPTSRVEPSRPFQNVGIDFCGYFNIKNQLRKQVITKAYICLFTCFCTRAVHLEVVEDLSTEAFLAALRRFVSRRGISSDIYSDNATNFVGANNQLKELRSLFMSQAHKNEVLNFCNELSINWHFIPPRSPHFGSLWESAIKQAKYHLKRSVNEMIFTARQLETIACQIESCLNSRPLTPLSDDPEDFKALTPGHFLIGQELNAIPEPIVLDLNVCRLNVWQKMQRAVQEFWFKWKRDYVNTLQHRNKWQVENQNVKIGLMVLIFEDNIPPNQWSLGRIIQLHPGKDDIVRVVSVKTSKGIIKRAITKLAPLPINDK